jgi:hypothetical protein
MVRRSWWWWLALAGMAAAATEEPAKLKAVVVTTPPRIDGKLDDACWQQAAHVDGFFFPTENRRETERTEAWVCFDADHLYVAWYCHDRQPGTILHQQTVRGGYMQRDDHVALLVDPSDRRVEHYLFEICANGTQNDVFPQGGSANHAWRGTWDAAAQFVPDGYTVEVVIPLRLFRYRRGTPSFGIAFMRNLEREEEQSYWPPMRNRYEVRKLAELGPLTLKNPVDRVTVLPYAMARADRRGLTGQSGLDVRYAFPSGVRTLGTLNPDFKTIEDVVDTIAFTYTPTLLGETRPFFAEGSGHFPESTAWYSRRVPDLIAGAKAFGRIQRHEFGALTTLSDRARNDTVAYYTWRPNPNTNLKSGAVLCEAPNQPLNIVTAHRFKQFIPLGRPGLTLTANGYHSFTDGPGRDGNAWDAGFSYSGNGVLGCNGGYKLVSPSFHAADGYVPDNDIRGGYAGLSGGLRTMGHTIQEHTWALNWSQYSLRDGRLLSANVNGNVYARFDNGINATLTASAGRRLADGVVYHDKLGTVALRWGLESLWEEGGWSVTAGRKGGGEYVYSKLDQGWSPLPKLRLGAVHEYTYRWFPSHTKPTENRSQCVATATYDLSKVSSLSARFVERRGALNLFLAYRLAPFTGRSLYLFLGDPNARRTQAQVQVKMVWPL